MGYDVGTMEYNGIGSTYLGGIMGSKRSSLICFLAGMMLELRLNKRNFEFLIASNYTFELDEHGLVRF